MFIKIYVSVLIFLIVCGAGLLLLDIAYLIHGSVELFPTNESQDKVRIIASLIATALIFIEILLFAALLTAKSAGNLRFANPSCHSKVAQAARKRLFGWYIS